MNEFMQINNGNGGMEQQILTPVEYKDGIFLKRDDYFTVYNVCGGKARAAHQIITDAMKDGQMVFVTAGSRMSPQCEIVSCICQNLNVDCHLFMPNGKSTSVLESIQANTTSHLHLQKVGYNSVIIHHAMEYAKENGYFYIPFGMECEDNIEITKHQVRNIPKEVRRIVIPCGSGMSMISVIKGLEYYKMYDKEVLGVVVGKKPDGTFGKFLPNDLFNGTHIKYSFVDAGIDYHKSPKTTQVNGVELDPIYESKCIPFLKSMDLLWIVGHRILK